MANLNKLFESLLGDLRSTLTVENRSEDAIRDLLTEEGISFRAKDIIETEKKSNKIPDEHNADLWDGLVDAVLNALREDPKNAPGKAQSVFSNSVKTIASQLDRRWLRLLPLGEEESLKDDEIFKRLQRFKFGASWDEAFKIENN